MRPLRIVSLILLIILVCLLAIALATRDAGLRRDASYVEKAETGTTIADFVAPLVFAGAEPLSPRRRKALESEDIVVDTLNLTHWLRRRTPLKKVDICDIISAIDETAPILRSRYPGRVIYVTKDRETATDESTARFRALYQAAAKRNKVYVNVVERIPDASSTRASTRASTRTHHAALGRDDFYIIMLSWKLNCAVLSRDRFHDLADMKAGHLDSFQVYSYAPFRSAAERDFVNPSAPEFRRMWRPTIVDYTKVLPRM